ncbi:MAG: hypothetical protein SNJ72_05565 [Fimbriimonadales bacterium]
MKRWLILMAMVVAMMSVASAKRVFYPPKWNDPLCERQPVQVHYLP